MGEVRPWQVVIIVLALLGAVGMSVYSFTSSDGVEQSDSLSMVDVATGELFISPFPKGRPAFFPAKSPDTGTLSLYPAFQKDGKWMLEGRYIPVVKADKATKLDVIGELRGGELKVKSNTPRRANVFGG
jgi:hypothetical protein